MIERQVNTTTAPSHRGHDWKGYLALAWVLWWGSAYAVMVLEARAPQILCWIKSWVASH
jgi:hypothetical protein